MMVKWFTFAQGNGGNVYFLPEVIILSALRLSIVMKKDSFFILKN